MEDEKHLYLTKWWDYRVTTPKGATLIFIRQYVLSVQDYFELLGDSRYVNILKTLNCQDYANWTHWKTFTKLRQFADANGMPYELFMDLALSQHMEMKFKNVFPNVFLNKTLLENVKSKAEALAASIIRTAQHDFFKGTNYRGHELQNTYGNWIMEQWRKSGALTGDKILTLITDDKISTEYLEWRLIQ